MLASSQNANVCIRCALRLRLRTLRQRRLQSSAPDTYDGERHFRRIDNDGHHYSKPRSDGKVRYFQASDMDRNGMRRTRETAVGGFKKIDPEGVVRRQLTSSDLARWGLDAPSKGRRDERGFREALQEILGKVKDEVKEAPVLKQVAKDQQEMDEDGGKALGFNKLWKRFTQKILQPEFGGAGESSVTRDLKDAFRTRGKNGLEDRIKYAFYGDVTGSRFTSSDIRNQKTLADLRYPTEWYPATRAMARTIHLHVGPTNSGKTFQALQRLEQAETGVYAGPLRLLAHEVYTRLNAKGKDCVLVTGEERRVPENVNAADAYKMYSCTVEMVPLNKTMDVAVIDEIQMIGNADRGWAWTQAVLGVKAKEVHLCGEERTVPLIQELCASVGEKLEIHRYERLSPLQVSERSLDGDLRRLRKGDCIVSFSIMGIHALRRQIEKSTGRKVATVYGSLPPETRAQQARLFNDPNNDYDYLVASDAVGMGLNLAIKRIIFEASSKFNGVQRQTLSIADIKQIGGRAGRFRTAAQVNQAPVSAQELAAAKGESEADQKAIQNDVEPENVGLVTTLEKFDFPIVRAAMSSDPEPIQSAGLFPPAAILERFAGYFPPGTPFSYILTRLHELSQMHKRFHLCGLKDQTWIADLIEGVEGLGVVDRNIFCSCPASKADNDMWKKLLPALAKIVATQSSGNLADIEELPLEIMETEGSGREYLRELERLHKAIVVYLWLSYRFAGIFNTRAMAFRAKQLVEEKIEKTLSQFSFSEGQRRKLAQQREKELLASLLQQKEAEQQASTQSVSQPESALEDPEAAINEDESGLEGDEDTNEERMEKFTEEEPETEYEEDEIGSQLEGTESNDQFLRDLHEQTSQIAGGDSFAGEEMGLEEPGLEPDAVDRKATTLSDEAAEASNAEQREETPEQVSEGKEAREEEEKPKQAAGGM